MAGEGEPLNAAVWRPYRYGRNRWAEEEFFEALKGKGFTMQDIEGAQQDETFQTLDVRLFRLRKLPAGFCKAAGVSL